MAGSGILLGCAEAHDCNRTCDTGADAAVSDIGPHGGITDADASDAAPVVLDSGPFCNALLPQLVAAGWDQCTTYCPSVGVVLHLEAPERVRAALRDSRPPVIARVAEGRLLLDMLTVADDEVPEIAAALQQAMTA